MELYQEVGKQRVALILQVALSSSHISSDYWTTPNNIGAWGIVGPLGKLHNIITYISQPAPFVPKQLAGGIHGIQYLTVRSQRFE